MIKEKISSFSLDWSGHLRVPQLQIVREPFRFSQYRVKEYCFVVVIVVVVVVGYDYGHNTSDFKLDFSK